MSKFSVVILQRETNPHVQCFEEVARSLASCLRELGHETVEVGQGGRLIMFGANNGIPVDSKFPIPDDSIVFNTEQMTFFGGRVQTQMQNFDTWKKHVIWDYSQENARRLREAGAKHVVHCPIGYHSRMTSIEPAAEEDIDVLFYGSVNPRRREVLQALQDAGIDVKVFFGAYGKERDDIIARSKIVLNIHAMDEAIWEIFRVSHLLANKKCVVSEDGGKDEQLETFARKATVYRPIGGIVSACKWLLADAPARRAYARDGLEVFKETSFRDSIRNALEQS